MERAIRSVPALAAGLRRTHRHPLPISSATLFGRRALVPLYQVDNGSQDREVAGAVHAVRAVADMLRRLASAYGEWHDFDVPAFFNLWPEQARLLVQISERVSTVHVTFYADLLLPSFQRVERYWAEEFFPAFHAAHPFHRQPDRRSSYNEHFLEITQPKMVAYWERLLQVVGTVQEELSMDPAFLAAAGGGEERERWRRVWQQEPAPGLPGALLPPLDELPSLTLSMNFPLPAHRQLGRLRRLRRTWRQLGLGRRGG